MSTVSESDENPLASAAALCITWIDQLPETRRELRRLQLLRVLAQKTLEYASQGVPSDETRFNASELVDLLEQAYPIRRPDKSPAAYIKGLVRELHEKENLERVFQELARDEGGKIVPKLCQERSKGGRGNQSHYWLEPSQADPSRLSTVAECDVPVGGLRYRVERVAKLPIWARWLQGLDFDARKRTRLALIVTAAALFTVTASVVTIKEIVTAPPQLAFLLVFAYLTVVLLPWALLWPFIQVFRWRIAPAPELWLPLTHLERAQIQVTRIGPVGSDGFPLRRLEVVTYGGRCPICDSHVSVHPGRLMWRGRMIGRCDESPREHVFSFDHVTRVGNPLRQSP